MFLDAVLGPVDDHLNFFPGCGLFESVMSVGLVMGTIS
jgi:hypothetical protein